MAWLLSKKLIEDCANSRFSQEQAAEFLADTFSAGERCALWNGTPTQRPSWLPAKTTAACRLSRSGMMFKPLTEDLGKAVLTWCLEASHAKTYPAPAKEPESPESAAECGNTWRELSAKFDPVSHSWKTHLCLWEEDLAPSSLTLPKWGMMRNGVLWERTTPAHLTSETESGYSLPTPLSCSAMASRITKEAAWSPNRFPNLETVVGRMMWPTPTSHNAKEQDSPTEATRNTPSLTHLARGGDKTQPKYLNPVWVEWLMGWPIGWTDCDASATDKCQPASGSLGNYCLKGFKEWLDSHGV